MSSYMIIGVDNRNVRSKQLLKLALILGLNTHPLLTPERFGSLILRLLHSIKGLAKKLFGFYPFLRLSRSSAADFAALIVFNENDFQNLFYEPLAAVVFV